MGGAHPWMSAQRSLESFGPVAASVTVNPAELGARVANLRIRGSSSITKTRRAGDATAVACSCTMAPPQHAVSGEGTGQAARRPDRTASRAGSAAWFSSALAR